MFLLLIHLRLIRQIFNVSLRLEVGGICILDIIDFTLMWCYHLLKVCSMENVKGMKYAGVIREREVCN